jgi:2-methylcitrate dehydratase PrpD
LLGNGERRTSFVLDPHGMPADPVSNQERLDKFTRLAGHSKSSAAVNDITRVVQRAEKLSSVRVLVELI